MNSTIVHLRSHAPSPLSSPPTVGIWRMTGLLHRGKWCDLYAAQPADALGSPRSDYVVKIVRQTVQEDPEAARQIRAEAAAGTSARHPHLITILDGQLDGARPYLVMPRIEAFTLESICQSLMQPIPVALWWIRQCAQALTALHQAGWVHGDVKPDNILIDTRGHATVIDLGFAQRIGTLSGPAFLGTPDYSAPERMDSSQPWGPASDIYSLGVVLRKLLSKHQQVPPSVVAWINAAVDPRSQQRPTAAATIETLLKLEIETLHLHIQPRKPGEQSPLDRRAA